MTKKSIFRELKASLEEAVRIHKGEIKPSRVFKYSDLDIKKIRRHAGISQNSLARMIGVSERTLQNWEQGRRQPHGPAQALLRVFKENPKAVVEALSCIDKRHIAENTKSSMNCRDAISV